MKTFIKIFTVCIIGLFCIELLIVGLAIQNGYKISRDEWQTITISKVVTTSDLLSDIENLDLQLGLKNAELNQAKGELELSNKKLESKVEDYNLLADWLIDNEQGTKFKANGHAFSYEEIKKEADKIAEMIEKIRFDIGQFGNIMNELKINITEMQANRKAMIDEINQRHPTILLNITEDGTDIKTVIEALRTDVNNDNKGDEKSVMEQAKHKFDFLVDMLREKITRDELFSTD